MLSSVFHTTPHHTTPHHTGRSKGELREKIASEKKGTKMDNF